MRRTVCVWLSLFWTRTETDQTKSLSSCITGIESNVYLVSSSYYLGITQSLLWSKCFINHQEHHQRQTRQACYSDIFPHQQCKSTERPLFSRVRPLSAELQSQRGAEATGCYSQPSSCTTTLPVLMLWMNFLQYCQTAIHPGIRGERSDARLIWEYLSILRATSNPSDCSHATREAGASPVLAGIMSRQREVVHLFSYAICPFQIKCTGPNTSGLYHIPTSQKRALQTSRFFPSKHCLRNAVLKFTCALNISSRAQTGQISGLKASLKAYSKAGPALLYWRSN